MSLETNAPKKTGPRLRSPVKTCWINRLGLRRVELLPALPHRYLPVYRAAGCNLTVRAVGDELNRQPEVVLEVRYIRKVFAVNHELIPAAALGNHRRPSAPKRDVHAFLLLHPVEHTDRLDRFFGRDPDLNGHLF